MNRKIGREDLLEIINSGRKFKLVDVLGAESYEKMHISGAISIPLDEIDQKAPQLLQPKDTVIVYCIGFECQASTKAAEKLTALGYENVSDYRGASRTTKRPGCLFAGLSSMRRPG